MELPESELLAVRSLSGAFSDMSESYKLFWMSGILEVIRSGRNSASFEEIINHMITDAWYMVSEYHLNLGPSDTLEKLVVYAQGISGLKPSAKPEEILEFLTLCRDSQLSDFKMTLTRNVPYRFQAPFLPDFKGSAWKSIAAVVDRVNRDDDVIYHFGGDTGLNRTISICEKWQTYFAINQAIVSGWLAWHMITYLQRRNPNVPGISSKLYPPVERKMEKAKKFWKGVIETEHIRNIYAPDGNLLTGKNISLDHFVPWSYVAHDELWNLVPTTRECNSSKSNALPNWDRFFPVLAEVEYSSYRAIWSSQEIHKLFDDCSKEHVNSAETYSKLYVPGITRTDFTSRLKELVLPAYQSARNLGFGEWTP